MSSTRKLPRHFSNYLSAQLADMIVNARCGRHSFAPYQFSGVFEEGDPSFQGSDILCKFVHIIRKEDTFYLYYQMIEGDQKTCTFYVILFSLDNMKDKDRMGRRFMREFTQKPDDFSLDYRFSTQGNRLTVY